LSDRLQSFERSVGSIGELKKNWPTLSIAFDRVYDTRYWPRLAIACDSETCRP
jgi:hypothetical protein